MQIRETTKTLFILHSWEGRRAFYADFVVPPSFVNVSRHRPLRVLLYSSPVTGASGRGLLSRSQGDFFSQLRVFIHSALTYGLPTTRPLSGRNKQLLLVPSKLLLYVVVYVSVKI